MQNPKTDSVHIDVWNFESLDGSVVDRLKRLGDVKDSRGLKRLITDTVAPPAADRLIGNPRVEVSRVLNDSYDRGG